MKPIEHKVFKHLMDNKLYWSEAYQSLNISARNLLWCFFAELRHTGKWGDKNNPHIYLGNGQLSFTETELKNRIWVLPKLISMLEINLFELVLLS